MTFIEVLKDIKFLVVTISSVVIISVGGYLTYKHDLRQLELTQRSILKSQISYFENNPCSCTRNEWANYEMLFSQYQGLLKKDNELLKESHRKPMARLRTDSQDCYRGSKDGKN